MLVRKFYILLFLRLILVVWKIKLTYIYILWSYVISVFIVRTSMPLSLLANQLLNWSSLCVKVLVMCWTIVACVFQLQRIWRMWIRREVFTVRLSRRDLLVLILVFIESDSLMVRVRLIKMRWLNALAFIIVFRKNFLPSLRREFGINFSLLWLVCWS